ncbi:MAG: apolipoprotein N-acyltransferase [Pseudomonadota bacterium]|nr:apolipoprotein N-acyltransferase [Pseudomonadota bacterium]
MQLLNKIGAKYRFFRVLIDVMAGVAASLALPPFFIVPALCFLGLPVWRVIHANSRVEAAGIFGAAGFGWFLASTFWVSHALIVSAPALWFLAPFVALALAVILAIFWAFAAAASWMPHASALVRALCLLATFALIEWARSFVASGFPWSLMGSVFAVHLGSLQMASVAGIYALTLLAFGCVIAPVLWLLSARWLALILLVLPVLGTGWGIARLDRQPAESTANAPIARLVQPAVLQQDKWNRQKRPAHLADLINLSQAGANKPDIVIWPETAFAGLPSQNRLLLADTVQAAIHPGGFLLTGIPRFDGDNRLFNSVFLFDHQAGLRGVYDKRHLVPFGEYVPFRSWIPFLDIIAGPADFEAGTKNHLIAAPGIGQLQILICYEVIFAGHVVTPQTRPDLMVNLTNDAWFGATIGPWQHLYQSQLRAVEEGIPLLRVANTGISAAFDGFGRQLGSIPLGERAYLDIAIPSVLTAPVFARFGNAGFFALCLGVFGVAWGLYWRENPKA